jgi:hypothetical protein
MNERLTGDLGTGHKVPLAGDAKRVMAASLFMLGLAMLLFGVAWGLVKVGLAVPFVVTVSLVIAAFAIRAAMARFGTGDLDWDPGDHRAIEYDYLSQSYYYRRPIRRQVRGTQRQRAAEVHESGR